MDLAVVDVVETFKVVGYQNLARSGITRAAQRRTLVVDEEDVVDSFGEVVGGLEGVLEGVVDGVVLKPLLDLPGVHETVTCALQYSCAGG